MNTLVVDVDESLVRTDLLFESIFAFLKVNPFNSFKIIWWIVTGGSLKLKNNLSALIQPRVENLPYRQAVIDLIREKRKENYTIVLASASPKVWVEKIAAHLGLFDHVIGSDTENLKGAAKYRVVSELLGVSKFIYVGDSDRDMEVWDLCGAAVAVNVNPGILNQLKEKSFLIWEIQDKAPKFRLLLKQMRVHQWSKNVLLFLPMIAAHKVSFDLILKCALGFLSFGFAASAVYVLNDLIDINSDRTHRSKKNRPLASGVLRVQDAIGLFTFLVLFSTISSLAINANFFFVILIYWAANILYTFYFKKEVILDIILLAGMYTIRIFAGASAVQIAVSHWLLSFSILFFFSLACVKRFTELSRSRSGPTIDGRGYRGMDQTTVQGLGLGTGMLSILVVLLYLQSPETKLLYRNIDQLWLLTPLLLYWLGRLWLLTGRDEIHDDPVVFAMKDRTSWICFAAIFAVLVSAI